MNPEQVLVHEHALPQGPKPEPEPDTAMVANSQSEIRTLVKQGTITWSGPLLVVVGRSTLMFLAQGLVAAVLALRGAVRRGSLPGHGGRFMGLSSILAV
jgi:hypothetical protein